LGSHFGQFFFYFFFLRVCTLYLPFAAPRSELNTTVAAHARDLRARTRELDEKTSECNSIREALTQQQRETTTLRRYVAECEVRPVCGDTSFCDGIQRVFHRVSLCFRPYFVPNALPINSKT
jgi:hypothetical protein